MDPSRRLPAAGQCDREGRLLVLSMRRLADLVGYCPIYEFEDLVCELAGAAMTLPAGLSRLELSRRAYRATRTLTGSRRLASIVARPRRTPVDGHYDLFLAFFNHPHELYALSSVEGWRRRSGFAACYLGEAWEHLLPVYLLELLREFDHVFVGVRGATGPIARITGRPCSYLPMGVDAVRFCPYPRPSARTIDVCSIGRRSPVTHRALLELARRDGLFYYYDTIRSSPLDGVPAQVTFRVSDHVEHRLLLASLLKRSRFFIVNRAWADEPARTRGGDEIAARFYEGAAAGAVLLGTAPESDDFQSQFGWPDSVVPMPFDAAHVGDTIAGLADDPARCARIRRENVANTLLRHDWVYRLRTILETAGVPVPARVAAREQALAALAAEARRGALLSLPA